ncbi:MAG: TonB-dependent receptor [Magnetococcales bacterium]|nr:TonB-dependent receptor [Magnetococcales bacterium]
MSASSVHAGTGNEQQAQMEQLLNMDFKELAEIRLTSAARKDQKLVDTTAAVTVIDAEEIRRSGMTSVPELLRLVPGLNVARINASNWAVTARGFNAQFSNKLLVLMDGRTLYTPLFAGVNWNLQEIPLADVERIEVIRGPGATMWGANAVNGVINIITRKAADTHGNLVSVSAGAPESWRTTLRHGGQAGEKVDYRVYATGFDHADFRRANNTGAGDDWNGERGGFRMDWHRASGEEMTLQGDLFAMKEDVVDGTKHGGHLLGRWTKTLPEERNWSLQLYFDRNVNTAFEQTNIYDADWQYGLRHQDHALMFGAGYRLTTTDLANGPFIQWNPPSRHDQLFNLFVQDEITLAPTVKLSLGSKVEHNDFTGVEIQPSGRLMWRAAEDQTLWAAVSRAVRTPARVDRDFRLTAPIDLNTMLSFRGNPDIVSETLLAWELGYRIQIKPELSLELAGFYNQYDHLVSTENRPPTFLPPTLNQYYANKAIANSYGVESAMEWRVTERWKLIASHAWMKMHLEVIDGSTDTTSPGSADDIPRHQWQVRSRLDLPHDLELDGAVFGVGRLSHLKIPAVTRLDLRLGWRARPDLNLSLTGQNLLDDRHPEFTGTSVTASEIPRAILARMDWKF